MATVHPDVSAVTADSVGVLWAWGANHLGQMGGGPGWDQPEPHPVPGLPPVRAVCTNASAALALDTQGCVWSWGWNTRGLLGRGRPAEERAYWLPTVLRDMGHRNTDPAGNPPDSRDAQAAPEDDMALAAEIDTGLQALRAELPVSASLAPVMEGVCPPGRVEGLPPVVQIALSNDNGFALDDCGGVWAWGAGGRLGLPLPKSWALPPPALQPVRVAGLPAVRAIAAHPGGDVVYALDAQGVVWSWGNGHEGALGQGKRREDPVPAPITGLAPVRSVHALADAALALLEDGQVLGWGSAESGVGFESPKKNTWRVLAPVPVAGIAGPVRSLWTGHGLAVYRLDDGTTWACGQGLRTMNPQDPQEPERNPRRERGLDGFVDFHLGADHGFGVDAAGRVSAFGRVQSGALGQGETDADLVREWTTVPLPRPVRAMAAAGHHSFAVLAAAATPAAG